MPADEKAFETVTDPASGFMSHESFATWDPPSSSWKTLTTSFFEGLISFSENWPRSGSLRNGMCFQRRRSARRTFASGASSWPTPCADRVANRLDVTCSGDGRETPNTLGWAVALWPTPDASVSHGYNQSPSPGAARRPSLGAIDKLWPTQNASEAKQGEDYIGGNPTLKGAAMLWGTPRVTTSPMNGAVKENDRSRLEDQAVAWATPMASDGHKPSAGNRRTSDLFHQAVMTSPAGPTTSHEPRTLNPQFVEALMGWPTGWTGSAFSATEWSRWKRRMRCSLSRLGWD